MKVLISVFNGNRIVKNVWIHEASSGHERHRAIGKISWTHYWLDKTRAKCCRNHLLSTRLNEPQLL